jgi:hypothetical protein
MLKDDLIEKLEKIKGLESRASKVAGGTALFYKGREIAHFHHNNEIDVRLTRKVIKEEGLHHPTDSNFHHHRGPSCDWIELRFRRKDHVEKVVKVIKRATKEYL